MRKRLLVSVILATVALQAIVIEASEPVKQTFLAQEYFQPVIINSQNLEIQIDEIEETPSPSFDSIPSSIPTILPTPTASVKELPEIKIGTPQPSEEVVTGRASWYNVGRGYYAAAGPALRIGSWRGRVIRVCNDQKCIKVKIVDWCQCYRNESRERIIDLSADAFAALFPLSKGLGKVTVKW